MCNIFTTFIACLRGQSSSGLFLQLYCPRKSKKKWKSCPIFLLPGGSTTWEMTPYLFRRSYPPMLGWEKNGMGPAPNSRRPRYKWAKNMMKKGLRGRGKCVFSKPPIFPFFFCNGRAAWALAPPPLLPICTQARTAVQTGKQGGKGGEGYNILKSEAAAAAAAAARIPVRERRRSFLKISAPFFSLSASFLARIAVLESFWWCFFSRIQVCPKNVQHPTPTYRIK